MKRAAKAGLAMLCYPIQPITDKELRIERLRPPMVAGQIRLHKSQSTLIERGGGEGLKIYDAIERDTHAWSVLQKRKHKLIGREWIVEPSGEGRDDLAAADFIRDVFANLPFDQICMDFLDATNKGFSLAEAKYMRDGRHIRPEYLTALDQRRFVFGKIWQPRLLTWSSPALGEKLPQRKFVVHRFGVKGNNP